MANAVLQSKRVLIFEDEPMIALDLETILGDAGMVVAGLTASLADAIKASEHADADIALLDANLGGKLVWPAADILQRRNIPILFLTGYQAAMFPERFASCRQLPKPVDVQALLQELAELLGPKRR